MNNQEDLPLIRRTYALISICFLTTRAPHKRANGSDDAVQEAGKAKLVYSRLALEVVCRNFYKARSWSSTASNQAGRGAEKVMMVPPSSVATGDGCLASGRC